MLDYIKLTANQTIDDLLPSLLIGHTYYIKDSTTYEYNEYVLVPKKKEYAGLAYDKNKVEDILIKKLDKKQVKLTFTAKADTTVKVYFTEKSYNNKTPDDTISLTANKEKTTIIDRENIYIFKFTNNQSIISAKIEGALLSCNNLFGFCYYLKSLDLSHFDTSKVTDMSYMFNSCYYLPTLDISNFDTSNVTNMELMFSNCNTLTTLDVSNFNTFNVTNMHAMFNYGTKLTTLDVSKFNTSKVTNMSEMFRFCPKLITIGQVDTALGWQHKPDKYDNMFLGCSATPKPSWYAA